MPDAVTSLLSEARKKRAIGGEEEEDQLVEIDPDIFKLMQSVPAQKRTKVS
jgi:hypothetical protein